MSGDYVQTQEKKATRDERPKNEAEPPRAMEADARMEGRRKNTMKYVVGNEEKQNKREAA